MTLKHAMTYYILTLQYVHITKDCLQTFEELFDTSKRILNTDNVLYFIPDMDYCIPESI